MVVISSNFNLSGIFIESVLLEKKKMGYQIVNIYHKIKR